MATIASPLTEQELAAWRRDGYVFIRRLFDREEMQLLLKYARGDQRLAGDAYGRRDATGQIISQWDGLSVDPTSLQAGDRFVQRHRLPLPVDPQATLVIGVYDGETLQRLTLEDGQDHLVLNSKSQ